MPSGLEGHICPEGGPVKLEGSVLGVCNGVDAKGSGELETGDEYFWCKIGLGIYVLCFAGVEAEKGRGDGFG